MRTIARALLILAFTAPAGAIPIPQNAVLWWDFQGSGVDRSGKGNDYILQNGAFLTGAINTGKDIGFIARLDGTNDRVDANNTVTPALDIDTSWAIFMILSAPAQISDKALCGKFTGGNAGYFLWVTNATIPDGGPDVKALALFLTGSDIMNYDRSQDITNFCNGRKFSVATVFSGASNTPGNVSMFVQNKKSKSLSGFSTTAVSIINTVCFQVGCRGGSATPSLFPQMDVSLVVVLQGGTMRQLEAQIQNIHWIYFGQLRSMANSGLNTSLGIEGYL